MPNPVKMRALHKTTYNNIVITGIMNCIGIAFLVEHLHRYFAVAQNTRKKNNSKFINFLRAYYELMSKTCNLFLCLNIVRNKCNPKGSCFRKQTIVVICSYIC